MRRQFSLLLRQIFVAETGEFGVDAFISADFVEGGPLFFY